MEKDKVNRDVSLLSSSYTCLQSHLTSSLKLVVVGNDKSGDHNKLKRKKRNSMELSFVTSLEGSFLATTT